MRGLRRVLRHLRQPAGRRGGARGDRRRRRRHPGGDRRADRRRALRAVVGQGPAHRRRFPGAGGTLQGVDRPPRAVGSRQPFGGQQAARPVQHHPEVDRSGGQEGTGRAAGRRGRLRGAGRGTGAALHGQPRQRPGERRRPGRLRFQPDLLRDRQRLDHQLPVRADREVRHHHTALRAAAARDGRERRPLSGRRADGSVDRRGARPDVAGRLRGAHQGRAGRPQPGLHLARLGGRRRARRARPRRTGRPRRGRCRADRRRAGAGPGDGAP